MGFMFFVIVLIAVGSIVFSIHHGKKVDESWARISQKLGLDFQPGSMMKDRFMGGVIDGFDVAVQTITRGSGKNSSKYTVYCISYPEPLRVPFSVTRQGFLSGLTKAFGAQDIEVGDPQFDSLVMIKGTNPREVISFLTPERRRMIQSSHQLLENMEVDDVAVHSETRGMQSSETILVQTIQRMLDLARAMVGEQSHATGTIREALVEEHTPVPTNPVASPAPRHSLEPEPKSVAEPLIEEVVAAPVMVNPASTVPTICAIAEALFCQTSRISEVERKFDTDYKGKTASGQGILRAWSPSSFDFVFGSGSYTKVTVEIPLPVTPLNNSGYFQAMVKMPVDAPRAEIGREFSFEGELVKVDGFTRLIYVDATKTR